MSAKVMEAVQAAPETPPPTCLRTVGMVTDLVATLAKKRAKNGMLSVEDVLSILEKVNSPSSPLIAILGNQETACRKGKVSAVRQAASSRNEVFLRVMVRPFEPLLKSDPPAFPRAFLPNYFAVLRTAFGDKLGQYEARARTVFQDMLGQFGNHLAWEVFFDDPRTRSVMASGLALLVRYIDSPHGQWTWVDAMAKANADGAKPTADQVARVRAALVDTLKAMEPIGAAKEA